MTLIIDLLALPVIVALSTAICSYLFLLVPVTKRFAVEGHSEHCFVKHKLISGIVWTIASIPATPMLLQVLISSDLTEVFKEHVFNATK